MSERRVMVKAFASEYQRGSKKEKGTILDAFVETTGYQRRYAARLLRLQGRRVALGKGVWVEADVGYRRRRKRIYDTTHISRLSSIVPVPHSHGPDPQFSGPAAEPSWQA